MDSKLKPFLFEGEALVRVVERDDVPWFMLADVCRILEIVNPTRAASRLDDDERGLHTVKAGGMDQEVNVISESGLYSLTLTSRKPAARRFKKWVTSEVLPTIRRTGRYDHTPVERIVPQEVTIRPKPFEEWTLEEIRTHLSVGNAYRHTMNNSAAAWYLLGQGFPRPPEKLMPAWWQADMNLNRGDGRAVVVVSVPSGGVVQ